MRRDLFVFDLDGTIVHGTAESRGIPPELLRVIRGLSARADISIATGRRFRSALVDISEMMTFSHHRAEVVVHNGLVVKDRAGLSLHREVMHREQAFQVAELLAESGAPGFFVCDAFEESVDYIVDAESLAESPHVKRVAERTAGFCKIIRSRREILDAREFPIIEVAVLGEADVLERVRDRLAARLPSELKAVIVRNIGGAGPIAALEVFSAHCSKWSGIQKLTSGAGYDRVITVGDDENDFEMIKCADVGVMMFGGFAGLKLVADVIVEGVPGLISFLEGFYQNEKS